MTQVNADIILKKSTVSGETPLAADLEVAEVAINTADGKLFTKHTDDSIKEISGKVSSVNGEIGDVSLGIQDMDDYKPQFEPSGSPIGEWEFRGTQQLTVMCSRSGDAVFYGAANLVQVASTDINGDDQSSALALLVGGVQAWVEVAGVRAQVTFSGQFIAGECRLYWGTGGMPPVSLGDRIKIWPAGVVPVGEDIPVALVEGDMLKWDDAEQAFRPGQLSYNDLTDQPTIPTVPVDSVNGETGAVSLGIQDMDDLLLNPLQTGTYRFTLLADGQSGWPNPQAGQYTVSSIESWLRFPLQDADGKTVPWSTGMVSIWTTTDLNGSWTVDNTLNNVQFLEGGSVFYIADEVSGVPITVDLGAEIWVALVDPGPTTYAPLADGDHLQWDNSEQAFRPVQLATVATSGSYNDLSDTPQNLVQVDTSTVLEGAQIYWDGTQWVAGVPPLSRGDGGDFDGGIILTQANAEVFGGGDFDSGFADSPFDGGEIT